MSRGGGRPHVALVGAGPGDPDLLTLRAEAALAGASVVVTDPAVVHLARAFAPDAGVVVSHAGGLDRGTVDRDVTVDGDAVALLAGCARWGRPAVRLYQGDPWLHPAFAVESGLLATFGVPHETVPGPAVELAVPGAAGIPVHHRPRAAAVTLAPPAAPGIPVHHRPRAAAVTLAPPAALPPAVDPARTLVTVTDDAAGLAARLGREGDGGLGLAVVTTDGGRVAVRRGSPATLAADPALGGGVVVVGAVTEAEP